jgi:hypothetical protein
MEYTIPNFDIYSVNILTQQYMRTRPTFAESFT